MNKSVYVYTDLEGLIYTKHKNEVLYFKEIKNIIEPPEISKARRELEHTKKRQQIFMNTTYKNKIKEVNHKIDVLQNMGISDIEYLKIPL